MSSALGGRTKLTQNDLRRFMSEQKKKLLLNEKKIDSPYAKYKSDGQILCILCNSTIKNDKIWRVHVNGKQHKENLLTVKQGGVPVSAQILPVPNVPTKRNLPIEEITSQEPKKIKGILKNAPKRQLHESNDLLAVANTSIKVVCNESKDPLTNANYDIEDCIKDESGKNDEDLVIATKLKEKENDLDEDGKANSDLPEGFFDDPVLDAKARNVEYKDPIQEEWEKFQKEIKEQNTVSDQIIEDDQEEAIAERQIDEIDEQIKNWSRVLDLEVKKEKVQSETVKPNEEMDQEGNSEDETDFDEFLDWRAKRSFR